MDPEDLSRHVNSIGRGIVQINARLNRVVEMLERDPGASPEPKGSLEALLDLLEAVEQTLSPFSLTAARRNWWSRLFSKASPDLRGLALGRDQALDRLKNEGILSIPRTGPVDPRLHRVIEVIPVDDPSRHGHIVRTHRQGWYRPGEAPEVLRMAQVTAWRKD